MQNRGSPRFSWSVFKYLKNGRKEDVPSEKEKKCYFVSMNVTNPLNGVVKNANARHFTKPFSVHQQKNQMV